MDNYDQIRELHLIIVQQNPVLKSEIEFECRFNKLIKKLL